MHTNGSFQNRQLSKQIFWQLSILLCLIGWAIIYSLASSIAVPTFHLDGAFQTASGLYRLNAGQFPGKDFFPYIGIGPLLMLFPLFKAMGANIAASVFTAQFMTLMTGTLATALIWHLISKPASILTSLTIGGLLFLAPFAITDLFSGVLPEQITWAYSPGFSLRPFRSFAAYLDIIIVYFFLLKIKSVQTKYLCAGLLTGATLLWSNDFAIPAAGLMALLWAGIAWQQNEFNKSTLFYYFAAGIVSWLVLLSLATLGHPLAMLQYNFQGVANDQWWYFFWYAEDKRVFTVYQLTRLISDETYLPLGFFVCYAIFTYKSRRIEDVLLLWIGAVLCCGGIIGSVGGHIGGYFAGFYFWAMMSIIAGLCRLLWQGLKQLPFKPQVARIAAPFLLGSMLYFVILSINKYKTMQIAAQNNPNLFFVEELGGYLSKDWQTYVNFARNTKGLVVFEEYWGLWSAVSKTFSNWPTDASIHALGHVRDIARKQLSQADMIISTRYACGAPAFQAWLVSENYWFYENLLKAWHVFALSPTTAIWFKNTQALQYNAAKCVFNEASQTLSLKDSQAGFYEIALDYNVVASGRLLLMVQNNISFGGDAGGFVSINPKGTQAKFPVYYRESMPADFKIKVIGNNQVKVNVYSCIANQITFNNNEILNSPIDFYLTNQYWVNGVARLWSGFFIRNDFADKYKIGRTVNLPTGERRKITHIQLKGAALLIDINGELLDPKVVSLPEYFEVTD